MDILRQGLDLGIGALALTEKIAVKAVRGLVKKGKIEEREGRDFIRKLIQKGRMERKKFDRELSGVVRQAVGKLNLATREDLQRLKADVARLKKRKR